HGLDPSCTTPKGPRIAVAARPRPEKSTMMPRQKMTACVMLSPRDPDCRFRKNDIVMGIMGKTQGVKIVSRPNPKATARNGARSPDAPVAGDALSTGAAAGSAYPAGIAGGATAAAAASTVNVAVTFFVTGGMKCDASQTW